MTSMNALIFEKYDDIGRDFETLMAQNKEQILKVSLY